MADELIGKLRLLGRDRSVAESDSARISGECAGGNLLFREKARRPGRTLTSCDGWWDIAAGSDLSDGIVPGDRLTGVCRFLRQGSLNS